MTTQPDLFQAPVNSDDQAVLRTHLYTFGWQTRKQLCRVLGWSERKVRLVAESMGTDIVRGQSGFKLTKQFCRESPDLPAAIQAADAAISQGKNQIRYGLGLKRWIHSIIG